MRLVRFRTADGIFTGCVEGDALCEVAGTPLPRRYSLDEVKLLAPCSPSKIVAVGLNYVDHAREVNLPIPEEPLLFLKPPSSIVGPGDAVRLPTQSSRVDYEAELAVVIGRTASNASREDARELILGYTCLNDITARDLQRKDGQWTRAKSFDTFCPIGPWIETELDPSDLRIQLLLNGESKQDSRTSNLVFDPFVLIEHISAIMTLLPGDVIATGTAAGIGPLKAGDTVEVRIEGIGSLVNPVEVATR
ncbi:MAG: fumarylacetoacetate hydrolase family protein [Desulfomonilaceae bacterium]|nr:fumarylacetoacetate hydrolase family protein [Desulfomonilaceae bacterium]